MKIVNILIPAAGKGLRFLGKGFTTLKSFIGWSNKTMLEHLIDGFQSNKYFASICIILRNFSIPPPFFFYLLNKNFFLSNSLAYIHKLQDKKLLKNRKISK